MTEKLTDIQKAHLKQARGVRMATPTDLKPKAVQNVTGALNAIVADVFALYLKTKNFHWHVTGPHVRDYHLLLDEQADQFFAMTDPIAERIRKLGGTTLRSIGTSRGCSGSPTTTQTMSTRSGCSPGCGRTISPSPSAFARFTT